MIAIPSMLLLFDPLQSLNIYKIPNLFEDSINFHQGFVNNSKKKLKKINLYVIRFIMCIIVRY